MTAIESELRALIAEVVREEMGKAKPQVEGIDTDRIASRLVFMLHIYPNYRVESRGPSGCIMDVLDMVAPDVAKEIRDGADLHNLFKRRWGE